MVSDIQPTTCQKKKYVRPELVVHGTIAALTLTAGDALQDGSRTMGPLTSGG